MNGKLHIDVYEKRWILLSVLTLVVFVIATGVSGFAFGFQVPLPDQRVDPQTISQAGPFAEPGLRELAPGRYEAYIIAQTWAFVPNKITIPAGSTVTFHVTSRDVQHGFTVTGTNINVQILPGYVSTMTYTFEQPGEYLVVCSEYCGVGHQAMYATIEVTP